MNRPAPSPANADATRLSDITPTQWRAGIAAWLGWLFDGLDLHLYVIVATPFVAHLMDKLPTDDDVKRNGSIIQAAFLVGWAVGGAFFGRLGDRLGRSRALVLTILTYSVFTGLSSIAASWWHLLIFRFLAALGIGGEWAVGAALLSESWPKNWRAGLAAVLQSAVNLGILIASAAGWLLAVTDKGEGGFGHERLIFLVGILPALVTLWIRRAVPETKEWHDAKAASGGIEPRIRDLFRGDVRRTTLLTVFVCAMALTGHWAVMYWIPQHVRGLPEVKDLPGSQQTALISLQIIVQMVGCIVGNFVAGALAKRVGYRAAIALMSLAYFGSMVGAFAWDWPLAAYWFWLPLLGACSGLFALFTMYLPPQFPTLLRTTGAGFAYNIGRFAAAAGTIYFGLMMKVIDLRSALIQAGVLFIPAAIAVMFMPNKESEPGSEASSIKPGLAE